MDVDVRAISMTRNCRNSTKYDASPWIMMLGLERERRIDSNR